MKPTILVFNLLVQLISYHLSHGSEFLEERMFVFLPELQVDIVIRPRHTGHVPRLPHGSLPTHIDNLFLQICVIGSQGLMKQRHLINQNLERRL